MISASTTTITVPRSPALRVLRASTPAEIVHRPELPAALSPSRDLALASPPSPLQRAAGCAAPLPSRRVARSLLAGGGRPSGFRPDRRRSASRRGLAATGPFAPG